MKPSIFTVLSLVFIFPFSCTQKHETVFPSVEDISESVFASGVIKSKDQYRAYANTTGILKEIYVDEGDEVEMGAVILEIFNETTRLNRESAALARAYADQKENKSRLKELEVNIELASNRLKNDSLLLARQKRLWGQGIGSALDLEQRELAFENAKTQYQSLLLKYEDSLREIVFNESNASKQLAITKAQESDLLLTSKVRGKVYAILVEKGEMVNPQTPLAIVGSRDEFLIEMQVDEYDIVKIKLGQKILVSLDSYRGEVFEAIVTKINPILDERNKSFTVEGEFVKKPEVLYPNLNFEANIVIQTKQNALTLPRSYLINENAVLSSQGDTLPVALGLKGYRKVEIISGVDASTQLRKP
ncbi:efflux RND transporter periplasmic adaptor subunit [Cecembia sp.]|uniref:efflux RND transporter periplasmic adaptor subunit n=1 Tax=Cecembia sp. TaxID=1898110 RepID=UPI0025BDFE57|nr:efflux RND transporter periplasmic adaptor subunit [Cecembia sp.]